MLLPKLIISPSQQKKNLHYFPKRTKKSLYFRGDLNKQINKPVPCFYFITPFLGCSIVWTGKPCLTWRSHPEGSAHFELVHWHFCWTVTRTLTATRSSSRGASCTPPLSTRQPKRLPLPPPKESLKSANQIIWRAFPAYNPKHSTHSPFIICSLFILKYLCKYHITFEYILT